MDKDIKQIGYGVKTDKAYITEFLDKSNVLGRDSIHFVTESDAMMLFKYLPDAKHASEVAHGNVVELYAREVEDSEDED